MKNRKTKLLVIINLFLSIIIISLVLLPVIWSVSFSFKPKNEQFITPTTFFSNNYTLENYKDALYPEFIRYIINSVIVSFGAALITLVISIFSAYAFSRLKFYGRRSLLVVIILSQLIPITAIIIPIYQLLKSLSLINTYFGLMLSYLSFTVPVSIWMLKGFFDNISTDIEEAALIDGCTKLSAFIRIVIPISKPGIAATVIWSVIATWQEVIYALAIITSKHMRTISVGILDFIGQWVIDFGTLFAGAIVVSVPIVVFFIFLQRYFVEGLVEGAIKG